MKKELKFKEIIEDLIEEINIVKKKSKKIHGAGNIKASGDEVENLIREKISLFLPERFMVKQGHIVNSEGKVINQLDIIIFDRLNTPKFFESNNDTVFYPIESVLAVGEIKKTLRKNDLIEFAKKIQYLKVDMNRNLISNSVYGGKLSDNSSLTDMINMRTDRKFKNPLFAFLFAVDVENIDNLEFSDELQYLPNSTYILNYGSILNARIEDKKMKPLIEDEHGKMKDWLFLNKAGVFCLAMMFEQLISHLNMCSIEPFGISHYMTDVEDYGILGKNVKQYKFNNNEMQVT